MPTISSKRYTCIWIHTQTVIGIAVQPETRICIGQSTDSIPIQVTIPEWPPFGANFQVWHQFLSQWPQFGVPQFFNVPYHVHMAFIFLQVQIIHKSSRPCTIDRFKFHSLDHQVAHQIANVADFVWPFMNNTVHRLNNHQVKLFSILWTQLESVLHPSPAKAYSAPISIYSPVEDLGSLGG